MMESIRIEDNEGQFLISISKDTIDKETLIELLNSIRREELSKKADLGEDVEQLGEEIKADWWQKNKGRWIEDE